MMAPVHTRQLSKKLSGQGLAQAETGEIGEWGKKCQFYQATNLRKRADLLRNISQSPLGHFIQDRRKAFTQGSQTIFYMRGYDGFGFAADQSVGFQFAQLLDQHFFCDAVDAFFKLAITKGRAEPEEDKGFPSAANLSQSKGDGAIFLYELLVLLVS